MAILRPASQLNSDDLPTFGRPTITTFGSDILITNKPVWRCRNPGSGVA